MTTEKNILLAEQNKILADYLRHMLSIKGWHIDIALSEHQLEHKISTNNYHLVMLSSNFAKENDLQCTNLFKDTTKLPVLGFTESTLKEEKKSLLQRGVNYCFTGPLYISALAKIIILAFSQYDL